MYRVFTAVLLGVLLLARAPGHADTLTLKLLRDYMESLRVQAGIPGLSVALIGPDGVFWEQALGRQDLARAVAVRTDTPFHVDGLTQVFTATLVLRCVEEGSLSLDDRIGRYVRSAPEPNATIRELLSHTSGDRNAPVFTFRPDRFEPLTALVRECAGDSYRETLANLLDRLAMSDSVPGPDILRLTPPAEGIPEPEQVERYEGALLRLAVPYAVDQQRRASPTQYTATTLTPVSGLISTVLDLAKFDQALRRGVLLEPATLAAAWTPQPGADGKPLPHGLGWFAQTYNGEKVVWQFGHGAAGSSSLIVTVPARALTFVLLANSTGLFKAAPLTVNDLVASPFVRLLLGFSAA